MAQEKISLPAGGYPAQLVTACQVYQVEPGSLLDWALKRDEVVLILPAGQKIKLPVVGRWVQLPLPESTPPVPAGRERKKR